MLKTIHRKIIIFLSVLSLFSMAGYAQNAISSPYSNFGVGLLSGMSPTTLAALGKTSYAMQSPCYINFNNPASYAAFDSLSFIADAAFSIFSNTLKTSTVSQKSTIAHADYIAIGLPVTRHWRTSVGILPFSNLGYNITDSKNVDSVGKVNYLYEGDGGLIQLYWGNAFKLYKGLSLGINVSYIFGSLNKMRSAEYEGDYFYNTKITNSTRLDGIYLSAGLQYFTTIKKNHRIGFGLVYENTAYIWAKESLVAHTYLYSSGSEIILDTIAFVDGEKGKLVIPQTIGGGFSYQWKEKLLVGVDISWKNWQNYKLMGKSDSLKNNLTSSFGIQFIPDPISSKYIKRVNIRAGARYSTGYFKFNDTAISEFGVSFGLGFPLKGFNTKSSINVLFEYGQIGTIRNDLIRENFFRVSFNFILQEKWYQRVKLE